MPPGSVRRHRFLSDDIPLLPPPQRRHNGQMVRRLRVDGVNGVFSGKIQPVVDENVVDAPHRIVRRKRVAGGRIAVPCARLEHVGPGVAQQGTEYTGRILVRAGDDVQIPHEDHGAGQCLHHIGDPLELFGSLGRFQAEVGLYARQDVSLPLDTVGFAFGFVAGQDLLETAYAALKGLPEFKEAKDC